MHYQVDLVIKALNCKVKYTMNFKPDYNILGPEDQILLSNLPRPWTMLGAPKKQAISVGMFYIKVTNAIASCECSLSAGLYYLVKL